ncbi:MAG: exo-alpha-sialidase, partial [Planctomycetaceae bacterium]|nr:exo-alpha-sialidase [Planctomycetaceae bacterium]
MPLTRRRLLQSSSLAVAGALLGFPRRAAALNEFEGPVTISSTDHYHGWPTIARTRSGDLLVVVSGGREAHVCPFGRVELIRSSDGGHTWTFPQVICDTATDDRDSGILETARGTLIASTFTSLAYEDYIPTAADIDSGKAKGWTREKLARWQQARDRLSRDERLKALGCWVVRSTDNGNSWSAPINSIVNSPHGPIQLADGRLLYCGKQLWLHGPGGKETPIGAAESTDDGVTWTWIGQIPTRAGDNMDDYHELHAVEAADGRIVAQIRNHNQANNHETLQTESTDGG